MKFFMYGTWKTAEEQPNEAYDTFIGISATDLEDATKQLAALVGEEKAQTFDLYDIYDA